MTPMRNVPYVTWKVMPFCSCHLYVIFFLKVCFGPPKCPFKALFEAKFKRFIYYIKMFLWPDPHSVHSVFKDEIKNTPAGIMIGAQPRAPLSFFVPIFCLHSFGIFLFGPSIKIGPPLSGWVTVIFILPAGVPSRYASCL